MRETEGKVLSVERLAGVLWEMTRGKSYVLDIKKHFLVEQRCQVGG